MEKKLRNLEKKDNNSEKGHGWKYAVDYRCVLEEPFSEDRPQLDLLENMHKKLNQHSEC
jgi:hypothetical protein